MRHHAEERSQGEDPECPSPHQGLTGVKKDFLDFLDQPSTSWMQLDRHSQARRCMEPSQPTESWDIFSFQASEFSRGLFYSNSEAELRAKPSTGSSMSFNPLSPQPSGLFLHCNTPACSSRSSSPCLCHGWEDTEQTHSLPEGIITLGQGSVAYE